jgi:hypothetical protein
MAFAKDEILTYSDLLGRDHQVIYLETSGESGNHLVIHIEQERERRIWLRPAQVKGTGQIYEKPKAPAGEKRKGWTIGDPVPEYAIKKRGRAAK